MIEAELVRGSQKGDGEAFRDLVEPYREVLFGTAYLLTRDRGKAEDLVQDALVRAWKGLPAFRAEGSFKAWVLRILVNEAMSKHRKKRLEETALEHALTVPQDGGGVEDEVLLEEERLRLQRGMATLREDQKQVVVLRYYSDLSILEIARALGCREGTVKSRLHRALRQLGRTLGADNQGTGQRARMGEGG
ncbi:MAG: RNA polymerase sigma factor [Dehalococcoidia bacterium]